MRQRYTVTLDLDTDEIPALAQDTLQRALDRAFPMARMETLRVLVCAPNGEGRGSTPGHRPDCECDSCLRMQP